MKRNTDVIEALIAKLMILSLGIFVVYECVYYNIYLYGNMDAVVPKLDVNYSIDTSSFVGQVGSVLGYLQFGVYICIISAVGFYLKHYKIHKTMFLLWFGMILCSVFTLAHSEDPMLYLTGVTALSNTMAPGTVCAMSCAFLFTNENIWNEFVKRIKYVIYFALVLSIIGFLGYPYSYVGNTYIMRLYAFKWIKGPLGCLMMLLPLSYTFKNKKKCLLQTVLFILSLAGAILMQSRMSIISLFVVYFIMNYFVSKDIDIPEAARKHIKWIFRIMIIFAVFVVLFTIVEELASVIEINNKYLKIFLDRTTDDTRSSQYIEHLPIVLDSLPFGIGYPSTSVLQNYASYGIDNGLLMLLYYCGLPMLLLFMAFVFPPILGSVRVRTLSIADVCLIAIGGSRLVWLFSSFTPSLSIGFIILMITVGRCRFLLKNNRKRISRYAHD